MSSVILPLPKCSISSTIMQSLTLITLKVSKKIPALRLVTWQIPTSQPDSLHWSLLITHSHYAMWMKNKVWCILNLATHPPTLYKHTHRGTYTTHIHHTHSHIHYTGTNTMSTNMQIPDLFLTNSPFVFAIVGCISTKFQCTLDWPGHLSKLRSPAVTYQASSTVLQTPQTKIPNNNY